MFTKLVYQVFVPNYFCFLKKYFWKLIFVNPINILGFLTEFRKREEAAKMENSLARALKLLGDLAAFLQLSLPIELSREPANKTGCPIGATADLVVKLIRFISLQEIRRHVAPHHVHRQNAPARPHLAREVEHHDLRRRRQWLRLLQRPRPPDALEVVPVTSTTGG